MSDFDTDFCDVISLPELEERMIRYSRIVYQLAQPDQYLRHKATHDHYKRSLIALMYEHNRLGGRKSLGQKIDRLFESLDKVRELQNKKGE
tara:strand:+ start:931 stop:1203 length:273 start_codon:yes stop_codon:yes gene_type:complete